MSDTFILHGTRHCFKQNGNSIILYNCTPYNAKITASSCKARKEKAEGIVNIKTPFKDTTELRLSYSHCLTCKVPIYTLEEENK